MRAIEKSFNVSRLPFGTKELDRSQCGMVESSHAETRFRGGLNAKGADDGENQRHKVGNRPPLAEEELPSIFKDELEEA